MLVLPSNVLYIWELTRDAVLKMFPKLSVSAKSNDSVTMTTLTYVETLQTFWKGGRHFKWLVCLLPQKRSSLFNSSDLFKNQFIINNPESSDCLHLDQSGDSHFLLEECLDRCNSRSWRFKPFNMVQKV